MSNLINGHGAGWMRDLPDFRDYTLENVVAKGALTVAPGWRKPIFTASGGFAADTSPLPSTVDLRQWCSPVEDQGPLGSCTAFAGIGLVEYSQRRAFGKHLDASPRFLYKATRDLLHWQGDTGAYLRSTLKALALLGVAPEEYWPYDIAQFDVEPPVLAYALGQSYQALRYLRLDPAGRSPAEVLERVKVMLVAGFPSAFGFTVYESIYGVGGTGNIPFPGPGERVVSGHAVCAVGYDDHRNMNGMPGGLLVRNSWGTGWGASGYGWLPYAYVTEGLAVDFWSVLRQEWIDTGQFG